MTTYRVSIAKRPDGSADAWVVDLPGCRAAGASLQDAIALLPPVAGEYMAWLARHGEPVNQFDETAFDVIEEIEAGGDYSFEVDRVAMSREEMEREIRIAGYAHTDLLSVSRPLPDSVLDWRPPASSVKFDQIYQDVRSIREMLEHAASTESNFYVGSLSDPPAAPPASRPDLESLHESTAHRLRALPDESLGRLFKRTGPRGEMEWTARKAMRRIVAHKRFHTKEIEQRLCWLTLGVPEILPVNRE